MFKKKYTERELLERVPVVNNKQYDAFLLNKEWLNKWYEAHRKDSNNDSGTLRIEGVSIDTKDG